MSTIQIAEILKNIYSIHLNNHVYSYLIVGEEKAILIDTGWGTADLKEAVASLTALPLLVVNTHGHLDHIYGNYQFAASYSRDEDLLMMHGDFTEEKRSAIIKRFGTNLLPKGLTEESWIKAKLNKIVSLNTIQFIAIGGRTVEVVATPGHTAGSVCLLDKKSGALFSGDTVGEGDIMLHFNLSTSLKVYLDSLKQLLQKSEKIKCILPSHGKTPVDFALLNKVISAVEKIIKKEIAGEKQVVFNRNCLLCNFSNFNILYREDSL